MEALPHVRKFVLAGVIATVATLGTSAAAYGKGCSGSSSNPPSSVAQYVEQTPTACGQHAAGSGTQTRKVPKSIQQKIDKQGGEDAGTLTKIVSSEAYGAPQTKITVHKVTVHKKSNESKILSDSAKRQQNPLVASVGVITDGSEGRLIALIVLMAAVAAIVLISALRRRRVTR